MQLRQALLDDSLDEAQPIVAEVGSMSRGNVAQHIQADCGLCRLARRAFIHP